MRISNVVLHFGQIRGVVQILELRHVCLCLAVLQVHRAFPAVSWQTLPVCGAARSIEVILELLIPRLVVDIGGSTSCLDLFLRILIVHFLKRIFVKVDRLSVCLGCNLRI